MNTVVSQFDRSCLFVRLITQIAESSELHQHAHSGLSFFYGLPICLYISMSDVNIMFRGTAV